MRGFAAAAGAAARAVASCIVAMFETDTTFHLLRPLLNVVLLLNAFQESEKISCMFLLRVLVSTRLGQDPRAVLLCVQRMVR